MEIGKFMKRNVVFIPEISTIHEAASAFVKHHVGLLPIVDQDKKLVGVVGLRDLLALELPDFVNFTADLDFVHNFDAVETTRPSAAVPEEAVKTLVSPAISVTEDTG